MANTDERFLVTDPAGTKGKTGWTAKARGRYPQVKIKKAWEPRPVVGSGQGMMQMPLPLMPQQNTMASPTPPMWGPGLGAGQDDPWGPDTGPYYPGLSASGSSSGGSRGMVDPVHNSRPDNSIPLLLPWPGQPEANKRVRPQLGRGQSVGVGGWTEPPNTVPMFPPNQYPQGAPTPSLTTGTAGQQVYPPPTSGGGATGEAVTPFVRPMSGPGERGGAAPSPASNTAPSAPIYAGPGASRPNESAAAPTPVWQNPASSGPSLTSLGGSPGPAPTAPIQGGGPGATRAPDLTQSTRLGDPANANGSPYAQPSGGGGGGGSQPSLPGMPPSGGGAPGAAGGGSQQQQMGPSNDELQQIALYAAQQWGISPEEALSGEGGLLSGDPQATEYMRIALSMLRAGAGPFAQQAPDAQNQGQIEAPGQGPATPAPPAPGTAPAPTSSVPPAPPMSDQDYAKGVKANPVLHAAVQYGAMANAEAGPSDLTLVTYVDGNRRWFHKDGTQVHPEELMGLLTPAMTQGLDPNVASQGLSSWSGQKPNPASTPPPGSASSGGPGRR